MNVIFSKICSVLLVRDTFCSYPVMDLCTKGLGQHIPTLKVSDFNLKTKQIFSGLQLELRYSRFPISKT
jgi:hypothetical protein